MSTRKKNTRSSKKKQPAIDSYFSVKPKPSAVASPSKRLVQSSLAVRSLRSRKVPEDDDVLDLTRSTSPAQDDSESPPSNKKQRTGAGPVGTGRVTRQSARHMLFDNNLSPLTTTSSPTPSSHSSRPTTPTKLDEGVKAMAISPSPSLAHARHRDSMIIDDPNDIVESSQTQYIHLQFTPPSQRTRVSGVQRVPAPAFTPPSNRSGVAQNKLTSANRAALDDSVTPALGPYDWHIPSSQGEVSEPRTPRKRNWAAIDKSRTPSKASVLSAGTVVASSVASGSQNERSQMPPPLLPASVMREPAESVPERNASNAVGPLVQPLPAIKPQNRQIAVGKSPSSRLATLRAQAANAHPSSDDRPDHVPSSQGEPSLAPTELGTMESPQRPAPYPSVDTDLLTTIPSSNPASQEAANALPAKHNPSIPPVPRPDFAQPLHPRTPSHAHIVRGMTSSPSNLPSPRALLESLGLGSSTQGSVAPLVLTPAPTAKPVEKRALNPRLAISPERPVLEPIQPPQDSPERGNTSSQTIIPSSQPIHDSSPPPDYDIDAEIHSFNQAQMQHRPHYQHSSQEEGSSQALPPSQSPIKNSRVDPNQSGAGMNGVFGMLGFGSEADSLGGSFRQADPRRANLHTSMTHDLPPSSPPPETPPHHNAKVAERESQFGTPGSMAKYKGSPLALAFERARTRPKTVTPIKLRAGPSLATSPITAKNPGARAFNLDSQTQDETVVEDSQPKPQRRVSSASKSKTHTRSQSVGVHNGVGSTRPKRTPRALRPTAPSQRTPLPTRAKDSEVEFVDSSDVDEQAMEIDARAPLLDVATSPARGTTGRTIATPSKTSSRVKGKGKENTRIPSTPIREERLPSSVSPSPIRVRKDPTPSRHSSPSPLGDENTQTQDETETLWETLRPSQSVSQVLERKIVEEALEEAERGRALRAEQEKERLVEAERKEKEREMAIQKEKEKESRGTEITMAEQAAEEERAIKASSKAVPVPLSQGTTRQFATTATVSTPKSRRILDKEMYIVTPTKIVKRTPIKAHRDRTTSMTPSTPVQEDEGEYGEEYTYVDETFNPTESQMSFLNRIMNSSGVE